MAETNSKRILLLTLVVGLSLFLLNVIFVGTFYVCMQQRKDRHSDGILVAAADADNGSTSEFLSQARLLPLFFAKILGQNTYKLLASPSDIWIFGLISALATQIVYFIMKKCAELLIRIILQKVQLTELTYLGFYRQSDERGQVNHESLK
ncbi:unnamed protein product [Dibothriocephalus latus]|uniref:Uncharacterized protein n=1 Tax=Dibothriocephalus latus TaxID=60516 RepID=A0A3P7LXC8_DIBLA|nr:unnamed protein product [Dibothriocephalus latus]